MNLKSYEIRALISSEAYHRGKCDAYEAILKKNGWVESDKDRFIKVTADDFGKKDKSCYS